MSDQLLVYGDSVFSQSIEDIVQSILPHETLEIVQATSEPQPPVTPSIKAIIVNAVAYDANLSELLARFLNHDSTPHFFIVSSQQQPPLGSHGMQTKLMRHVTWIPSDSLNMIQPALLRILNIPAHSSALNTISNNLSQQQLFDLLYVHPEPTFVVNSQDRIIRFCNHAVYLLMHFRPDELIGQCFDILFSSHEDTIEFTPNLLVSDSPFHLASAFKKKNGEAFPADVAITPFWLDQKQLIVLTVHDVTDRNLVVDTLIETSKQLHLVLAHAPVMLLTINPSLIITLAHGQSLETIDRNPLSMIYNPIVSVFPNHDEMLSAIRHALQGVDYSDVMIISGRLFDVQISPLIENNVVTEVVFVATDITESDEMQQAREEARQALATVEQERRLIEFREGFMSMVSHEFRTPLTVILSSIALLKTYANRLTPDRHNAHLNKIQLQAAYMQELMEDVLLISRARSGRLSASFSPVDVRNLVLKTIEDVGLDSSDEHHFHWHLSGDFSSARLDPKLVQHVIVNLLQNAIKYTPPGGEINLRVSREDDTLLFVVSDTGIGIPEQDQSHLFVPFHRAENAGSQKGTGLGLALVKISVDAMSGQISVDSTVGVGTTFTVRLPITPPAS